MICYYYLVLWFHSVRLQFYLFFTTIMKFYILIELFTRIFLFISTICLSIL